MTVIGAMVIGDTPALIGDTLVTSPGVSDNKLSTPLLQGVNDFTTEIHTHVSGLRQKVNILSNKVMVAWAGSYIHARSLFQDIKRQLDAGCDPHHVLDIVKQVPPEDINGLSILGLARGAQTTKVFWAGGTQHFNSSIFRNLILAGSGEQDLAALIHRVEDRQNRVEDDAPEIAKIALYSMGLAAQAAGIEHLTQQNLLMQWGGGIEISLFSRGEATKIGELLYAFWRCENNDGTWDLTLVPTFVKVEYQGDLLVTQTVSEVELPRIGVIPPLLSNYRDMQTVQVAAPKLSYDWLCSSVVFFKDGAAIDVISDVQGRSRPHPIGFVRRASILPLPHEPQIFPAPYRSSLTVNIDRDYMYEMALYAKHHLGAGEKVRLNAGTHNHSDGS